MTRVENNCGNLIRTLILEGYLKTPRIIDAFRAIDRKDFVPEALAGEAYVNVPLPIGFDQTISQPLTVAFMLELLKPHEGNRILDIGYGSGWQTALLAHIVTGGGAVGATEKEPKGRVYAIERIPALCAFGEANIAKYNFIKRGIVKNFCRDGSRGLPEEAPFDRIIAGAAAQEMPAALLEQISMGGRLVVPIRNSIWLFQKRGNSVIEKREFPGFAFVPLISSS